MSSATIQQAQDEIIEQFSRLDGWEERYRKLIELGRQLPEIPEEYQIERFRVKGCASQVFLHPEWRAGTVHFDATSDAMIVRGLIALLLRVYSDRRPDEILATPPDFIRKIGLSDHLSPTRANGLAAMVEQIRLYALAFKQLAERRAG
ncbi:MAG TPA: SufE family protein [Candidatus Sumerlaeota bacterium]|nr:MAG: Cysteine desulfuration protein SufE [candidate division BRC1 bacterium ADurb.BinA292]HOR27127.1 SufE family protein [Candidatus Sumerlaeota bacterium]HPK01184.1 SufE family protein [Candidatus Sumerlaeota bacterium]